MNLALLKQELTRDEARRSKVYFDSLGIPSIAVGRNLRDVGLSDDEIDLMLDNDINRVTQELNHALPWWVNLNDARKRVLVNLGFMGVPKVLQFHKMLAAMQAGEWEAAATELLDSQYATQVGDRAKRLADMMRSGT